MFDKCLLEDCLKIGAVCDDMCAIRGFSCVFHEYGWFGFGLPNIIRTEI